MTRYASLVASFVVSAVLAPLSGCGETAPMLVCNPACPAGTHCADNGCVPDDPNADLAVPPDDMRGGGTGCVPACSGMTPQCNAKGVCVPCLEDAHCPAGQVCKTLGQTTACVMGCADDTRCPGGGQGAFKCCGSGCVDTTKDAQNCGACGMACSGTNARSSCESGKCVVGACNAGWGDCNMNPNDGCETSLRSDPNNCTACGKVCSLTHGINGCADGCYLRSCDFGYDNCDGNDDNGCERAVLSDPKSCGSCDNVCGTPPNAKTSCINGSCQLISCNLGYSDCDGNLVNGCEITTGADIFNCGMCGNRCAQGLVCTMGMCTCPQCNLPNSKSACVNLKCAIQMCNINWGDCDGLPQNGCELNLTSDARNCGACGAACAQGLVCVNGSCTCPNCMRPNAKTACVNNMCVLDSCFQGYGNCDGNDINGCETDLSPDAKNCGACGNVCPQNQNFCQQGKCTNVPSCHGPFVVDQTFNLDNNFMKQDSNFHPQGMEYDSLNNQLVIMLQNSKTARWVDLNGVTVGQTMLPAVGNNGNMMHSTGITIDGKNVYVVDYTGNASTTDLVRYDRNGAFGLVNGINPTLEIAAYGGYPITIVGSTLYRGKIINNTYNWTGINEIRVSDVNAIDNIVRTLATGYIARGIGDMAWDGSALWVLGYALDGNPDRTVDLWRVDPNTGAKLEDYQDVFTMNQPLRPAGLAYGNNSLYILGYPEAQGTAATLSRLGCR